MTQHSQAEREHAERAHWLRCAFTNDPARSSCMNEGTVNNLAEFLHQQYRAAAKAMHRMHKPGPVGALLHDHGWCDCYGKKKEYFLRRARWLLTDYPAANGRVGKWPF